MKPLISVILPVYNCEKYINQCIDSILCQTYPNFELLIIDDCSTDNTVNLIQEYKDERIKLTIKEKNSGYTDSLNWAISIAKGEYIARMDGDDISMPTRFEEQLKIMEANPKIIVCGTNAKVINTQRVLLKAEFDQDLKLALFDSNPFIHPSVMIKKSIFNKTLYDKLMEPAEDFDLWCKISTFGEFYNVQKTLLAYRIHSNNISVTNNKKQIEVYISIKTVFFKELNYNTTLFSDDLIKKYFIGNKTNNLEFKNLLLWFIELKKANKRIKKYDNKKFNTKINNMSSDFVLKFFKQNKIYKNFPFIFNLSFFQQLKVLKYYTFKI
jgi:glycosyltransferase involved in cell wall biosynthesis